MLHHNGRYLEDDGNHNDPYIRLWRIWLSLILVGIIGGLLFALVRF